MARRITYEEISEEDFYNRFKKLEYLNEATFNPKIVMVEKETSIKHISSVAEYIFESICGLQNIKYKREYFLKKLVDDFDMNLEICKRCNFSPKYDDSDFEYKNFEEWIEE